MTNKAPFCASLRLIRTVFSQLLKKAVSMALWTKATLCVKSSLLEQSLPRTPNRQIRSLPTYQVGPRNLRNPWLIKDLRAYKVFYNCRETFTDVMRALQIKLFMQNKANFRKVKLNVNKVLTRIYEYMDTWSNGKNEPKTNPNEPKFKKAKMNINNLLTKEYEKMINWALYENEPNSKPIQTQTKPISEAKNDRGGDQQKDLENKG